ncbi:uncharacterized protein LOC141548380 [Sminthopsis crassicaudata]|uniref:uncharacterized protein LOC141548380 n=1 Tax=Sminthopsis crassicaudata TaxID=9301 RepID=UPI003D6825C3
MGDSIPVADLGGGEEEGETFDESCGWTCFCNSCPPPRGWWTFAEANEEDEAPSNLEVQEEGPVDIESSSDYEFPTRESPTEDLEIEAFEIPSNKRSLSPSSEQEGPAVKLVKVRADDLSSMKEELASIKNNVDFLLSSVEKMEGEKPPPKKRGRPPKNQDGKTTKKTAATKKNAGKGKAQKAKKEPAAKKGRRGPAAKAGKEKSSPQPKQTRGKAVKKSNAKLQEEDDKKKGRKKKGRAAVQKATTTKKGAARRVGRPRKSSSGKAA